MPAQVEEIEAAEREGIIVLTGLAPVEVVSRDGTLIGASLRRRPARPVAPTTPGPPPGNLSPAPSRSSRPPPILVAVGEEPDPSIPARRRRDRGQRLGGHRRGPRDAGDRPGRRVRRRRRRVRAEDDHRRGRIGPPGRCIDPRISEQASPMARRAILETVRYRTAARASHHPRPRATRPRAHAPLPDDPGPVRSRPRQVGFDETHRTGARPPAASAATRSMHGSASMRGRRPVAVPRDRPPSPSRHHTATHENAGGAQ